MSTYDDDFSTSELVLDVEPLAEEAVQQARRLVASFATDAGECRDLLAMLGLLPAGREEQRRPTGCRVCGGPLSLHSLSPKCGLRGTCSSACRRKLDKGVA
ncbi:hypothetical protein [Nocardia wallacei]|uniref:hypothetical protein n=1 Tax=Nocardia wallacei TaxID=480035 RepID=UPI0024557B72|nr:hypothetical protein [Nocardia wallacei]